MKKSDAFPSRYLKAADIPRGDVTLTIKAVEPEMIGTPPEEKIVVEFADSPKLLVLNATNWDSIELLHGEDSDNWCRKKITLYATTTRFGGKSVDCIRVRAELQPVAEPEIDFQAEADGVF